MEFYAPFALPFMVGVVVLFATLIYKYTKWIVELRPHNKLLLRQGILSRATLEAVGEVISESLLHRRIFKINPLLGYMHASLAFGWFLLICVGWIETTAVVEGSGFILPQGHVFFKFFSAKMGLEENRFFAFLMDLLLLFVLSGVCLAYAKRLRSSIMGMRKTTRLKLGDRLALSSLWLIFPVRLVAESLTCAIYGGGGFLTGTIGGWLAAVGSPAVLNICFDASWWIYSLSLGVFFVAMPFSRYMHIFTEIPLIFMRRYKLHSRSKAGSFDNFQVEACSRCGICIDPCQLQDVLGINDVQGVYFLRERREQRLRLSVASNCLMCGRCTEKCPVGIDLNTLRLNSRETLLGGCGQQQYDYIANLDSSQGEGRVGYFGGCMTQLTPATLLSMEQIFRAANVDVWWADRNGGVCCGRPLMLSGQVDAAANMIRHNEELFARHNITTLVTSCPICLKIFREEYRLKGIELLHHSQYIDRLIKSGALKVKSSDEVYTYHDPCELGRGLKIYEEPREVITAIGSLVEPRQSRQNSLCCGASLANTVISDEQQIKIGRGLGVELEQTGASVVVTACPLCKKSIVRSTSLTVMDISEVVSHSLG